MLAAAAVSDAERRSVEEGIQLNFREDGRTLLQQRPVHIYIEHMQQSNLEGNNKDNGEEQKNSNSGYLHDKDYAQSNVVYVHRINQSNEGHVLVAEEDYNGSKLRIESDGTVILVNAVPSVIEVNTINRATSNDTTNDINVTANINNNSNSKNDNDNKILESETQENDVGLGELYIHIDAVSQVLDYYANLLGGRTFRYKRSYLSLLATLIRSTFGANGVNCSVSSSSQMSHQQQELTGVAAAERVFDDEEENSVNEQQEEEEEEEGYAAINGNENDVDYSGSGNNNNNNKYKKYRKKVSNKQTVNDRGPGNQIPCQTGFPSSELYIGAGYAFRINVHLHILQGLGGNITSLLSLAVHAALKTLQLPHVTLQTSAAGVTVEVDRSRSFMRQINWNELPLLLTIPIATSHHYVIDPSLHEESTLTQQCVLAANSRGQICTMQFIQLPSRKRELHYEESHYKIDNTFSNKNSPRQEEEEEKLHHAFSEEHNHHERERKMQNKFNDNSLRREDEMDVNNYEFNLLDCAVLIQDGVQICQATIEDCNKALQC